MAARIPAECDRNAKVILLHIPRTGGTTLSHALFAQCEPGEVITDFTGLQRDRLGNVVKHEFERYVRALPPATAERCRIFAGHIAFGVHFTTPGKFQYVSFLRNPIDRVVSGFFYGNTGLFPKDKEWLKFALHLSVSNGASIGFNNPATRILTGSDVLAPTSPELTTWDLPRITLLDLQRAIKALRRNFLFVGITEHFNDSSRMLFDILKKEYSTPTARLNATSLNLKRDELPIPTLRLLERKLDFDIALYAEACSLFNARAGYYGYALAEPYVRVTPSEGAISSGDHAHVVSADHAFGGEADGVWLSWPFYCEKSGEFIGYVFPAPRGCRSVALQLASGYPTSFFVEASDDEFDRDIRQVHQIAVFDDAPLTVELPEHTVEALSWRLKRAPDNKAEPLSIASLSFGQGPLPGKRISKIRRKTAKVRARFHEL